MIKSTINSIKPLDETYRKKLYAYHKTLLMPEDALSPILSYVEKLAAIKRENPVHVLKKKVVVLFAADHGVVAEGVSAYPQEVTRQMLQSFANEWAVITVLAKKERMDVLVVDTGVIGEPVLDNKIINQKIRQGTNNFVNGPSMSEKEAIKAIEIGIKTAEDIAKKGYEIAVVGEMGIGNTTSASAITSLILNLKPEEVTGRGTGVDDNGLKRKIMAIKKGLRVNKPDPKDAVDVLFKVGGFEIGAMTGFILGCAAFKIPLVLDGFITGSAALLANNMSSLSMDYCFAGHCSMEIGHRKILEYLKLKPLLNLDLRLGEGSGAALALSILESAIYISRETATFATAKVSNKE